MTVYYILGVLVLVSFACLSTCQKEYTAMTTDLSRIAYEMCPHNEFCQRKVDHGTDEDIATCCAPCSCNKDCYIVKTCCPDAKTDYFGRGSMPCKHQDEHFNLNRHVYLMLPELYPRFYVTETCQANFRDEDIIAGCRTPRTIRDHVYVTDPSTTVIYKNEKCALCNDVTDFITWHLRIACPFNADLYSADQQYSYILDTCSFASEPPSGMTALTDVWKCYDNVVNECNVTGQWDRYDAVLEKGCSTFNTLYRTTIRLAHDNLRFRSKVCVYQNVYCYLCNTDTHTHDFDSCSPMKPDTNRDVLDVPFTTILDISSVESLIHIQDGEHKCRTDEIEDPLTDTCIVVYCPFGQVAVKGRCESNMAHMNVTLSAVFSFNYKLDMTKPMTPENVDSLYDTIFKRVQYIFARKSCTYCSLSIFSNRVILIHAIPIPKCNLEDLLGFFEHFPKQFRVKVNTHIVEVEMWLTSKFKFVSNDLRYQFLSQGISEVRTNRKHKCVYGAVLVPRFFCKRIKYSETELVAHGVSNATIAQLAMYSEPDVYVDGNATVHAMCLRDYMGIVNQGERVTVSLLCTFLQSMLSLFCRRLY